MNIESTQTQVLVVEDSSNDCVLIRAMFRPMSSIKLLGFLQDGRQAISYLQGAEPFELRELFPYPDLILLDFNMPRCDGMGVLEFLQRQIHRPQVVLWSNTLDRVDVSRALGLGADMVCAKPKTRQEFSSIINRINLKTGSGSLAAPLEAGCMTA